MTFTYPKAQWPNDHNTAHITSVTTRTAAWRSRFCHTVISS
jgi:hypothetical protein